MLEEDIPDPKNQGRIAFEIIVGLIEIGEYWNQNGIGRGWHCKHCVINFIYRR
jgi:hypothetical protein